MNQRVCMNRLGYYRVHSSKACGVCERPRCLELEALRGCCMRLSTLHRGWVQVLRLAGGRLAHLCRALRLRPLHRLLPGAARTERPGTAPPPPFLEQVLHTLFAQVVPVSAAVRAAVVTASAAPAGGVPKLPWPHQAASPPVPPNDGVDRGGAQGEQRKYSSIALSALPGRHSSAIDKQAGFEAKVSTLGVKGVRAALGAGLQRGGCQIRLQHVAVRVGADRHSASAIRRRCAGPPPACPPTRGPRA